jgi:hypothetical protein
MTDQLLSELSSPPVATSTPTTRAARMPMLMSVVPGTDAELVAVRGRGARAGDRELCGGMGERCGRGRSGDRRGEQRGAGEGGQNTLEHGHENELPGFSIAWCSTICAMDSGA